MKGKDVFLQVLIYVLTSFVIIFIGLGLLLLAGGLFKQLFLFRYAKASDTRLVLYHEGFHQFLDGILTVKPPQWFNEGVADFFGPSKHHDKKGEEGMKIQTNPWRLPLVKRLIKSGRTVPFQKLMTMSQQEMYGRDAGNHYAQAHRLSM